MARARALDAARQARTDLYRRLILDAAERCFARAGYDPTKIQDIAQEAGLSVGSLYGVFPGKRELHAALQEERGAELLERAREATAREATPLEVLLAGIGVYIEFFVAHPDYLRMQVRHGIAWALGPSPEAHEQSEQYAAWRQGFELATQIFRDAIDAGQVIDEDPELLAKMMIAMHQVHLADWLEHGMKLSASELVERVHRHFRRTFVAPEKARRQGAVRARAARPHRPATR
ncbi:MAG: TetR/AcrR family transcriptional regulator [bacterium]